MTRLSLLAFSLLFFLSACGPAPAAPLPTATSLPTPPPTPTGVVASPTGVGASPIPPPLPAALDLGLLKNFSYRVPDFNIQAALANGAYESGPYQVRLVEPAAFGDLNGDGRKDAAAILAVKSGGTGTFFDLVAVLDQDGAPVQAASSYIGDRQGIRNLTIAGGRIVLDYFTQGLHDALCCASERRLRSYVLEDGALRLVSEQVLDQAAAQATPLPNPIFIDQPAPGQALAAPLRVRGRVGQTPPEKKLTYSVTDMNGAVLWQGEVALDGQPGTPGEFGFELDLGPLPPGILQVEVVDAAGGVLRGRTTVTVVVR